MNTSSAVRVRFAPSPTGPLHIGGLRTALYNYLFAKKHQGTFILRIEDTDQTRFVPKAETYIKESLKWCGIDYDEGPGKEGSYGPYKQSERKALYKEYIEKLIASGWAYYAFDTPDELDKLRNEAEAQKQKFMYNHATRSTLQNSLTLSKEKVTEKLQNQEKYVVRFKTPQARILCLKDQIRGEIQVDTNTLDDKILFKSDGMPTYHLANIVDDHLMQITHVIRGEEWLPSLALHVLLYEAFGWQAPEFAHLPLILKPVGKGKLSKRDGDKLGFPVFPLQWIDADNKVSMGYREEGFYPEAVLNFMALLGWNPGTEKEVFSLEELITSFDLNRVNKSGAKFDPEKNKWFQQQHIQQKSTQELSQHLKTLLETKNIQTDLNISHVVSLVKERLIFTDDLWQQSHFFFETPTIYDAKAVKKVWKTDTVKVLDLLIQQLELVTDFTAENTAQEIKSWAKTAEIGLGKIMMPLRVALVGSLSGPDVFEICALIGKENSIARIKNFVTYKNV